MNDSDVARAGADRHDQAGGGMRALTPYLVCADASAAIEFYKQAFGAEEVMRLPMPDGKLGPLSVPDVDERFALAVEAGASEDMQAAVRQMCSEGAQQAGR